MTQGEAEVDPTAHVALAVVVGTRGDCRSGAEQTHSMPRPSSDGDDAAPVADFALSRPLRSSAGDRRGSITRTRYHTAQGWAHARIMARMTGEVLGNDRGASAML